MSGEVDYRALQARLIERRDASPAPDDHLSLDIKMLGALAGFMELPDAKVSTYRLALELEKFLILAMQRAILLDTETPS